MKTLTVRLPEQLVAQIEAESRERRLSKSDVVRERLSARSKQRAGSSYDAIADLGRLGWRNANRSQFTEKALSEDDGLWPQASSLTPAF